MLAINLSYNICCQLLKMSETLNPIMQVLLVKNVRDISGWTRNIVLLCQLEMFIQVGTLQIEVTPRTELHFLVFEPAQL